MQLKSNIKTPKGNYIIRKAEKALLNERVRSINNMINMFNWQINTCIEELEKQIKEEDMVEYYRFIEGRRESRHQKTLKRHLEKFNRLCHRKTVATQTILRAVQTAAWVLVQVMVAVYNKTQTWH